MNDYKVLERASLVVSILVHFPKALSSFKHLIWFKQDFEQGLVAQGDMLLVPIFLAPFMSDIRTGNMAQAVQYL